MISAFGVEHTISKSLNPANVSALGRVASGTARRTTGARQAYAASRLQTRNAGVVAGAQKPHLRGPAIAQGQKTGAEAKNLANGIGGQRGRYSRLP